MIGSANAKKTATYVASGILSLDEMNSDYGVRFQTLGSGDTHGNAPSTSTYTTVATATPDGTISIVVTVHTP